MSQRVNQDTGGGVGFVQESDALQRLFGRPAFLSLTIGVPFCVFKFLFGITLVRLGPALSPLLAWFGWIVTLWAGTDLVMNLGRELYDIHNRHAPFEYCSLAQVGRLFSMPAVFLAVDTLITFCILCAMLWSGWIATLTPAEKILWNAATTVNLISLSFVVLYNEIRRLL